jgi:hypothetical protein
MFINFGDRIISEDLWRTSPDLTAPEFFLWSLLKRRFTWESLTPSMISKETFARRLQPFLHTLLYILINLGHHIRLCTDTRATTFSTVWRTGVCLQIIDITISSYIVVLLLKVWGLLWMDQSVWYNKEQST